MAVGFFEKTDEQKAIVEMVRQFVDEQIIPQAEHYDAADEFPEPIVEQMKELGLFGVTIPEEHGGMGLDLTTYAMIVEELSRGWISISGIVNTHFIGSYLLMKFGTPEQQSSWLPRMATGEIRAAFSMSEPELGSDVAAIKTLATRVDDEWEINGSKMWVTNGLRSGLVFVLVRTDRDASPPHRGLTCFVAEKEPGASENPGLIVPPKIKKMGYKGVESTELVFDGYRISGDMILGGEQAGLGKGFGQMMDALGSRPRQRRGAWCRDRAAGVGAGVEVRAGAARVRQADRRAPGDPVQARRHGDQGRGRAAADAQGGDAEGRRRAQRCRGGDGEAVRVRDRQGGRRGLLPHPRRLRLFQGIRDRAVVPRRAAAADRRGHVARSSAWSSAAS